MYNTTIRNLLYILYIHHNVRFIALHVYIEMYKVVLFVQNTCDGFRNGFCVMRLCHDAIVCVYLQLKLKLNLKKKK